MITQKIIREQSEVVKLKERFFNIRLFKSLLFAGYVVYLSLLIENLIFASFFGYNIVTNYISELGMRSLIPFPHLNDFIVILGGTISLFSNFFFVHRLKTQYRPNRTSKVFIWLGFTAGIIGAVGYIFLGIFSLDRAGPGELYHGLSMGFSFGGFLTSIFFYSLNLFLTHNCSLKKVGIFGFTFPIIAIIVYGLVLNPLTEWIVLWSILAFLLPFYYYIFK